METDKIIVIGDRVLIKPEDMNKTQSGLFLPPGVGEGDKVRGGYVVKTGPGYAIPPATDEDEPWKENRNVRYIPLQAKEGDFALYLKKDAIEVEIEKEKMMIVPHSAILMLKREDFF